jgi:hypothetical protein
LCLQQKGKKEEQENANFHIQLVKRPIYIAFTKRIFVRSVECRSLEQKIIS